MAPGFARITLLVLAILGILAPQVSAVAASVAPGIPTVVICTGQGMVTPRLDAHGDPVQALDHPDHCLLAHATDTVSRVALPTRVAPILERVARPGGDLVRAEGYRAARPPPRAPPAAA